MRSLHRSLIMPAANRGVVVAKLAQHLVGVLAERRGGEAHAGRSLREAQRRIDAAGHADGGMRLAQRKSHVERLRTLEDLFQIADGAGRYTRRILGSRVRIRTVAAQRRACSSR